MKFRVDEKIFDDFPGFKDAILVAKDIKNMESNFNITKMLREMEVRIREIPNIEPVTQYPKIKAWLDAHRKFSDENPKKKPPSVYSLVHRVVKGGEIPSINALVDIYNYISLKHMVNAGGEDLDKCEGDINLTYASGDEEFIALGGTENDPPSSEEVVHKDDKGVICRRFNWREGDRTKLTK